MYNKLTIMGRLTAEPEIRTTASGTRVASFAIACNRDYKDQNGQEITDYINCVAWRTKADFVEKYLQKGKLMLIEGRLELRKWEDRDGEKRITPELVVQEFYFTGEPKRD